MKKILVLTALLLFVACNVSFAATFASSAAGHQVYGGVTAAEAAGTTIGGVLLGKMSKGVNFVSNYLTTSYALETKHTSGTKAYATASNSTAIYFKDIGTTAIVVGDLTAPDNDAFGVGLWTTM